jgi:hypothetical protein
MQNFIVFLSESWEDSKKKTVLMQMRGKTISVNTFL